MREWHVRLARSGDGPELAALHIETARGYVASDAGRFQMPDPEGLAEWFDEDLHTMGDEWICYVATDSDGIIGQVEARIQPPLSTARYQSVRALGTTRGYVNSLSVSAARRREGVGRELMRRAESWLAEHGATLVELDTLASSPDSVPFYEALGYRAAKLVFERELDPASR